MRRPVFPCFLLFGFLYLAAGSKAFAAEGDPLSVETALPAYAPALGFGIEGGDGVNVSNAEFFIPLLQGPDALFFTNFQFQFYDHGSENISAGLGYRKLVNDSYILGFNAYFDQYEGILGENFTRLTTGFEFLSEKWDFRVNGYFAGAESTSVGGNALSFIGNRVFLSGGMVERAYDGIDYEAGYRFATFREGKTELRIYGGGYNFNNEAAGFVQIAGAQVRLEAQLFALPLLGEQSQLIASASLRNDDVFDTHSFVGLQVRIPFGKGNSSAAPAPVRLSSLQHRMIQPVNRERFVTNTAGMADEQALDEEGDDLFVVNEGEDLAAAVANQPSNGTVVVNGTFSTPGNVTMQEGQRLAGGNSNLTVVGSQTGRRVSGPLPGNQGVINGTNPANPVVVLANNVTVQDLQITGGLNGMRSDSSLTGFNIFNNQVSGSASHGFFVNADIDGTLINNQIASAGGDGFRFADNKGTIRGNAATNSSGSGFWFSDNDGEMTGNTAADNGSNGFDFNNNNGTLARNTATNSGSNGFAFSNNEGMMTGNTSTGATSSGFIFSDNEGTMSGNNVTSPGQHGFFFGDNNGTLSNNTVTDAGGDGFFMGNNTGTMTNNTATGSGDSGFEFNTNTGTFTGNRSLNNGNNGFADNGDTNFTNALGATFSDNEASNNGDQGYRGVNNGTAAGNTGAGNAGGNTFP